MILKNHKPPVWIALSIILASASSCSEKKIRPEPLPSSNQNTPACTSTREFVTTLEFLRSKKEFQYSDQDSRALAEKVSTGCSGAGARFVKTTDILTRAGLGSRDAASIGIQAALKSDAESEAFGVIFKRAFLAEYLDLDLFTSVQMAKALSLDLKDSAEESRKDFEALTDFCVSGKTLDLPRPLCATFAQRVTLIGNKYQGRIAKPFTDLFNFLKSDKGPQLATSEAIRVAEQVISAGPYASENFISAYRYAVSKSGLGLAEKEAIALSHSLANKTTPQNLAHPATPEVTVKNSEKEVSPALAPKKRSRR